MQSLQSRCCAKCCLLDRKRFDSNEDACLSVEHAQTIGATLKNQILKREFVHTFVEQNLIKETATGSYKIAWSLPHPSGHGV
jgi:hypothetical protein